MLFCPQLCSKRLHYSAYISYNLSLHVRKINPNLLGRPTNSVHVWRNWLTIARKYQSIKTLIIVYAFQLYILVSVNSLFV